MKLELYYHDYCFFCQRVLAKIKQLDINSIQLKNVLQNPEFRKYHIESTGRSTVPCLYIDDIPMFESIDICEWLEKNKSSID